MLGTYQKGVIIAVTLTLGSEWHPSSRECWLSPALTAAESGGRQLRGTAAVSRVTLAVASARWNVLRGGIKRLFGVAPYYRAAELHESGVAHLHVLLRVSSRTEWLLRQRAFYGLVASAGFGRTSHSVVGPDARGVAEYVTKMTAAYVSKDAAGMPKWSRRGAWSRDWTDEWAPATPIAGFRFQLGRADLGLTREALVASGFVVIDPARYRVPRSGGVSPGEVN